jgi:ATPase, P-type (transporting), HAD superfamily, subfamily IC
MLDALLSAEFWRARAWTVGLVLVSLPILWKTIRGVLRGKFAADVVASLAIITSILIGQPLVGFVILLMQTGGEALERYAAGRASQALRQLTENAPHVVHLVEPGGTHDVRPDSVRKGDSILVRPGEMIPCDGIVIAGESHVDTSTLTGEPMPQRVSVDDAVMSGATNEESPLTIRVTAIVEDSQYARIVALVREAQSSKAPLQRLADRYAVWFTPFTIAVCGFAWILSGDWQRVLAVLAIATPCPLILATPVAILGGMNRAARRHILVRNGGALETLEPYIRNRLRQDRHAHSWQAKRVTRCWTRLTGRE